MFMFPFEVVNGNECLLITNRDELEEFIAFAQIYLSLPITMAREENQKPGEQHSQDGRVTEQAPAATLPATQTDQATVGTYSVSDRWLKKAWEAAGQPAQGAANRELYEAARALGYVPSAQNGVAAFKTAIRTSPYMERVGLRDNIVLWKWTDIPHETRRIPAPETEPVRKALSTYHGPRDLNRRNPQVGERAIDYAVTALKETRRPLTTAQLAEVMYDLGWKTSGEPLDTLASTLRKSRYGDIVTNQRGFWVLAGEQYANEQSRADAEQTLDLDELDLAEAVRADSKEVPTI